MADSLSPTDPFSSFNVPLYGLMVISTCHNSDSNSVAYSNNVII